MASFWAVALELSSQWYWCVTVPAPNTQLPTRHPEKVGFKSQGLENPSAPQAELPASDPLFRPFSAGLLAAASSVCLGPARGLQPPDTPTASPRAGPGQAAQGSGVHAALTAALLSYFPAFSKFSLSAD